MELLCLLCREACEDYAKATEKLGLELLGLLSQSLGLPSEYFHQYFMRHTAAIRINYYPPCPIPDLALGVSRHRDPGSLTVLVQDETGGLEVRRKDGEWIGVKPRRDAFVINLGDMFQVP
jgi:isopenicillin N synthase-like dioxygenase